LKKGGINSLNTLPNDKTYKASTSKNEFEDYIAIALGGNEGGSIYAQGSSYEGMLGLNVPKKSIRGGKQSFVQMNKPPTIRGGNRSSSN
jgi:hypothetical protein